MSLFEPALQPALDANGAPISGATWNFYLTGTTTPLAVYSGATLATSLGAIVTANAAGRFANIYTDDTYAYRAILKDAGGTTIKDIDPANGGTSAGGGMLPVSAFVTGTDEVDYTVNHQPGIQEAIEFALANNFHGIQFDKPHYSIWTPERNPDATHKPEQDLDLTGIPFVIDGGHIELISAPGGTYFHRRTRTGADPNVFANTQYLEGVERYWRGGMFYLKALASEPADYDARSGLTLRGTWRILGGLPISANPGQQGGDSRLTVLGEGWDLTDKPLWSDGNAYAGDFILDGDVLIDGFRGELIYQAGIGQGSFYQYGLATFSNTDGDGFNPNVRQSRHGFGEIQAQRIVIRDCYTALESTGVASDSRIDDLQIYDCVQASGFAGCYVNPALSGGFQPHLSIGHVKAVRSGFFLVHRHNDIGRVECIDTSVSFGTGLSGITGTYSSSVGEIIILANDANVQGVFINGQSNTEGHMGTDHIAVGKLTVGRTPTGKTGGFTVLDAVRYANSLGDNITIGHVDGHATRFYTKTGAAAPADYLPKVLGWSLGSTSDASHNGETTAQLPSDRIFFRLTSTAATGVFDITLPAHPGSGAGKISAGTVIRLLNVKNANVFFTVAVTNSLLGRRMIALFNCPLEFRSNGFHWFPLSAHPSIAGGATKDLGAISADALGSVETIAVTGARAGMEVRLTLPASVAADNEIVRAWVSADDVVSFQLRDLTGSGNNPAEGDYRVTLDWPN